MTDDTYRVEIHHKPDSPHDPFPYVFAIYPEDPAEFAALFSGAAEHRDDAIEKARRWIRAQKVVQPPETILLDRNGDVIPQSVRA
jgi:hypothetical protein